MAKQGYAATSLRSIPKDLCCEFGESRGSFLLYKAERSLIEYLKSDNVPQNTSVRRLMARHIYPCIALYHTLIEDGFPAGEAFDFLEGEIRKAIRPHVRIYRCLVYFPGIYGFIRFYSRHSMKKKYPSEGWKTTWKRYDSEETSFDVSRCIFWETATRCGCPEICTLFCRTDELRYSPLSSKVAFRRTKTIARGDSLCNFRFVNRRKSRAL